MQKETIPAVEVHTVSESDIIYSSAWHRLNGFIISDTAYIAAIRNKLFKESNTRAEVIPIIHTVEGLGFQEETPLSQIITRGEKRGLKTLPPPFAISLAKNIPRSIGYSNIRIAMNPIPLKAIGNNSGIARRVTEYLLEDAGVGNSGIFSIASNMICTVSSSMTKTFPKDTVFLFIK